MWTCVLCLCSNVFLHKPILDSVLKMFPLGKNQRALEWDMGGGGHWFGIYRRESGDAFSHKSHFRLSCFELVLPTFQGKRKGERERQKEREIWVEAFFLDFKKLCGHPIPRVFPFIITGMGS